MMTFDNLWWLLLLPLPFIVRFFFKPLQTKYNAGLKVPFFANLQTLKQTAIMSPLGSMRLYIAYFVWILLLLAACGPVWLGKAIDIPRSGRDLMLAIDISGSMQIPDMDFNNKATDRLSVVKEVGQEFIKNRSGDRLGLILFGTKAYLQAPLTFDLATVGNMLSDSTVGLAGMQTAIGDAIAMAIKHLKNYPNNNKVLILLTDGVNSEGTVTPIDAAKIAAKNGIRIYTIGLGANQVLVPSLMGPQLVSSDFELDEPSLKEIASLTNGQYFRAKNPQDLQQIYHQLNKIEPRMGEKETYRPRTPLYYWPLGMAFLLAVMVIVQQLPRGR